MFRRVLVPVFTVACRGKKNKPRLKKGAPSSAEKTKFIPKAFLQKQMAAAAAAERLIATERPGGSLDGEDLEEWLKRKPVDDVWIREHYPPQAISVTEAVLVMIFSFIQCTILFNLLIISATSRIGSTSHVEQSKWLVISQPSSGYDNNQKDEICRSV